jgi:hypothetical protein
VTTRERRAEEAVATGAEEEEAGDAIIVLYEE